MGRKMVGSAGYALVQKARRDAGRVMGFKALALCILLALIAHAITLIWMGNSLSGRSVLAKMAEPMFTRQISAQEPVQPPSAVPAAALPAPAPRKQVAKPVFKENTTDVNVNSSLDATNTVAFETPTAVTVALPPPPPVPPPTNSDLPGSRMSDAATSVRNTSLTSSASIVATANTSTASVTDTWPPDTRLSYKLGGQYRGELHGKAHVQWQREAAGSATAVVAAAAPLRERYQVKIDVNVGFLVGFVMTSQGKVTDAGLLPEAYEEALPNGKRGVLLRENSIVLLDKREVPKPLGVQDSASQFVELSRQFATGRAVLEAGKTVSFSMARPGGVDAWIYDIKDTETLSLGKLGNVQAFHLVPRPLAAARGSITMEIWYAPALQYLPVRIKLNINPTTFIDLMIDTIEQR
jgi:Protein of unknown function (DUF3108)